MGELVEGLLGGAGWGLVAGLAVGTVASHVLRPAISGLVRTTMATGDRLGQLGAQAREQLDDIVAEARAEQAAARGDAKATVTPKA